MICFQEQLKKDLDNVFFNKMAREFVTTHRIAGVRGVETSLTFECDVVVDSDLFQERISKVVNPAENITIDGLVFFIKKDDWLSKFTKMPEVDKELMFDGRKYLIVSVADNMGVLDVTLRANKGRR